MKNTITQLAARLLLACICAQSAAAQAPPGSPSSQASTTQSDDVSRAARSASFLQQARQAMASDHFPEAERSFRDAAELLQPGSEPRRAVEASLERVLKIQRQMAQLDEVEHFIDRRQYKEAQSLLDKAVAEAADWRVIERAKKLAARTEASWWDEVVIRLGAVCTAVAPYLLIIAAILIVARAVRWASSLWPEKWFLSDVADSTGQGAAPLVAHYFSYWLRQKPLSVTSGLLLLEASRIPLAPDFEIAETKFDIAKELQSTKFSVAGVEIGSVASLWSVLRRAFIARREIRGTVYLLEKRVCAHLQASFVEQVGGSETADGTDRKQKRGRQLERTCVVSAFASGDSPDSIRKVTEEVTFKMLYALSKKQPEAGEHANELRLGLENLRKYLSGIQQPDHTPNATLEEARQRFEHVRKAQPDSLEAYLYEGIALDLLERHEDAIAMFRHVRSLLAPGNTLAQRATYNEAVANLRNLYQLKGIEECIRLIDVLTTGAELAAKPLMALALATKADAWANRTIHWRHLPEFEAVAENQKLLKVIDKHAQEVKALATKVRHSLKVKKGSAWDADTIRQIEWALHNADADLYLYAATAMTKIDVSTSPDRKSFERTADPQKFEEYVTKASDALRQCETLLPAGVETLTNMGTLYLIRGHSGDLVEARRYFRRAIALNPNYEYAYYRLAQCWEKDRWREKVVETLQACPVPPVIPSFVEMFGYYFVQPKAEYPAAATA